MPRNRVLATAVPLSTSAETVIATLAGLTTRTGDTVDLEGVAQILGGTTGTDIRLKVRRGADTTGAVVGATFRIDAAGAVNVIAVIQVSDNPPESAGLTYVLTAANTGATANGSAVVVSLQALYGV